MVGDTFEGESMVGYEGLEVGEGCAIEVEGRWEELDVTEVLGEMVRGVCCQCLFCGVLQKRGWFFFLLDLGECGIHLANVGVGFFTCARPHSLYAFCLRVRLI